MDVSSCLEAAHAGQWPATRHAFEAQVPAQPPSAWGGTTWAQGILRWSLSRLACSPLDPAIPMWDWLDELIEADLKTSQANETARLLAWASALATDRFGWRERTTRWQAWAEAHFGGPARLVDHLVTHHAQEDPAGTDHCPIHPPQLAHAMLAYRPEDADLWQGLNPQGQARLWGWLRLRNTFTRGRHLTAAPHAGTWPIGPAFEQHARARLAHPDPWQDIGAVNLALAHPPTQPRVDLWQVGAFQPAGLATWDMGEPWPSDVADVWEPFLADLQHACQARQRTQQLTLRVPPSPTSASRRRI